ncbi:MAG: hypothetical protein QME42_11730, partial [bacterium]|nr:hypothetical protein [bacterium]
MEIWEGTISLTGGQTKVIETDYRLPITSYQLPVATITLSLTGVAPGTGVSPGTGDVHTVTTKQVEFGELVDLAVKADLVYPVGYLEVPFEVVNRGKMDSEFVATWTILATGFTAQMQRNNPLPPFIKGEFPLTPFVKVESLPAWCKAMPKVVVSEQGTVGSSQGTGQSPKSETQVLNKLRTSERETQVLNKLRTPERETQVL